MDFETLQNKVFSSLYTSKDRFEFINQLDILSKQLYLLSAKRDILDKYSDLIAEILSVSNNSTIVITKLRAAILTMQEVTMELAFQPKVSDLERIALWIKGHLGNDKVLVYKFNAEILGGTKFTFNGKFIDCSLATKLDAYWNVNIKKLFASVGISA